MPLVADVVLNGFGRPAYSENDGMPWNNPEVRIETDAAYAKKLLAEGGWADADGDGIVEKNGLKAEFCCIYPAGDSVRQAVAMAVRSASVSGWRASAGMRSQSVCSPMR